MKKLILTATFALLTSNLFAQGLSHTVSLSASSISGAGLSYRYRANEISSFKVTSFVVGKKKDKETDLHFNLGGEYQFDLVRGKKSRLYTLAGASYWYSKDESTYFTGINEETNHKEIDKDFHFGTALGVEAVTFDNIVFNVDFGVHYFESLDNGDFEIGFGGGIGVGYTFGK